MTCKAAEICQSLGYHQLPIDKGKSSSIERSALATFSMIYIFDKGLSLRLGRSSNLQDHDITSFDQCEIEQARRNCHFQRYLTHAISYARLQGKTYEQLYSASGLALQPDARFERAQELLTSLWKLRDDMRTIRVST
jgi:hypothetical protein